MDPIYLDFNSTAPLLPQVANVMANADAIGYVNPASQHALGRRAQSILEAAREKIAGLLGADTTDRAADRLIFTSGGTEANNLALLGWTDQSFSRDPESAKGSAPPRIIISSIEHPSITAAADYLAHRGWQIDRLAVDQNGVVQLNHFDQLLAADPAPRLVSIMLANNETGVLQPVAEIVRRCAQNSPAIPVHTDAVQAVGKIPIHFRELGVAAMTIAPHKFGGPRGIGALLVRHGVNLHPILHGAAQQLGLRPGTESVSLALGFLAALRVRSKDQSAHSQRMATLRDHFEAALQTTFPHLVINGRASPRLPHTSNMAFVGHDRQALFMALDMAGLYCSTGSACASGSSEPSPTLLAMQLPKSIVESSLRFSLGPTTTAAEIDEALRRISQVIRGQR